MVRRSCKVCYVGPTSQFEEPLQLLNQTPKRVKAWQVSSTSTFYGVKRSKLRDLCQLRSLIINPVTVPPGNVQGTISRNKRPGFETVSPKTNYSLIIQYWLPALSQYNVYSSIQKSYCTPGYMCDLNKTGSEFMSFTLVHTQPPRSQVTT